MGLHRCRCIGLLLVLTSLSFLCGLIKWSSPVPTRIIHRPQVLHEVNVHQVHTGPKEDPDTTDRGMYDEIELTEEDLQIAAEKRASLKKSFKQSKDVPQPAMGKTQGVKYPSSGGIVKDPGARLNSSGIGNATNALISAPVVASIMGKEEDKSGTRSLGANNTLLIDAKKQKYGAEIIAEPSQIQPPPNVTISRKAKVRLPHVNRRVVQQLHHIQAVGQQLHDLQSYMQDDRIYYQYQKNKSRQANLSDTDQRSEQEREARIFKKNSNVRDIRLPVSPPDYNHGYPIEFQSASFIPSGQDHNRPSKSARHHGGAAKDTRGEIMLGQPDQYRNGIVLRDDLLNARPNQQRAAAKKNKFSSNVANAAIKNETNILSGGFGHKKSVQRMDNNQEKLTKSQSKEKNLGNISSMEQSVASTVVPTGIRTTSLKYEHLPHGDLTIHQAPHNASHKPNQVNATEDKVIDLGDKDADGLKDAVKLSKAFIESISSTVNRSNDTVATASQTTKFQRPTSVHRMNSLWQVHDYPQAMYLYSAYYDDRPALDRNKVRIIGIANAAVKNPHCLLWYPNQITPDVAITVLTKIGPRIQPMASSSNRYEPYIFTCAVMRGKGPPQQVSMITIKETKPTTLLTVQIPVKTPADKQLDIGQCMSVVYWNQDPTRLIEWLELNRIWGVGEITVYGDELDEATTAVFADYAQQGLVDFRQMPNILDDDSEFTILLNMSPAINDCMYRNMYRYKKVLCTDVDEMIVPRAAMNYSEMMDQIIAAKGTGHPHTSFMFRNVYFFTDFSPHVDEPWFLHSQRYLKHIKPSEFGYSVKSITDPQACIALQNHLCWKRIRKYDNKNWTIDVPLSLGRNQHYKKCHFDSYLGQLGACDRMMKEYYIDYNIERFGAKLYDSVAQKLIQFRIADAL